MRVDNSEYPHNPQRTSQRHRGSPRLIAWHAGAKICNKPCNKATTAGSLPISCRHQEILFMARFVSHEAVETHVATVGNGAIHETWIASCDETWPKQMYFSFEHQTHFGGPAVLGPLLIFLSLFLAPPSTAGETVAPPPAAHMLSWSQGWNLVALQKSDAISFPEGVQLWRAEIPGQSDTPASMVWLHAQQEGSVALNAELLSTETSSVGLSPGWSLLSVSQPTPYQDSAIDPIYAWHPSDHRYRTVAVGDVLKPGVAYLVYTKNTAVHIAPSLNEDPKAGPLVWVSERGPRERTAPANLRVFGGLQGTVYAPQLVLRGAFRTHRIKTLSLHRQKPTTEDVVPISITGETFTAVVALVEGTNTFTLIAEDWAGNTHAQTITRTYDPLGRAPNHPPGPPSGLVATGVQETVRIFWQAPRAFADGSAMPEGVEVRYALYRNGSLLRDQINTTWFDDTVPEQEAVYHYHLRTQVQGQDGQVRRSTPSPAVAYRPHAPTTPPAAFTPPHHASPPGLSASQPKLLIVNNEGRTVTHLAYLVRDPHGQSDRIHYRQSLRFLAPNTATEAEADSVIVAAPGPQTQILELALAVHGSSVDIAWVEVPRSPKTGDEVTSKIVLRRSCNHGQDFHSCAEGEQVLRENTAYKRDLGLAYDAKGHHHMVWNESNKVYYLKDLVGERDHKGKLLSVFDIHHRRPATELVKTKVQYDKVNGQCPCDQCWCDDAYPLELEPDPNNEGDPIGPYLHWWEEAFVYTPSLHIDQHQVSIIAHQTRTWNAAPVLNPIWEQMYRDPVYSDEVLFLLKPTRRVIGWRQTWKTAYEAGDESLYESLGIQYQYRYRGTWQNHQVIKVAQRPLEEGVWAPSDSGEPGWKQGDWNAGIEARWRISVVDDSFAPHQKAQLSYPVLTTAPSGRLFAAYEKDASPTPNAPETRAIQLRSSEDGGKTWTSTRAFVASGHRPQIQVNQTGASGPSEIAILYYASAPNASRPGDAPVRPLHLARTRDGVHFSNTPLQAIDVPSPPLASDPPGSNFWAPLALAMPVNESPVALRPLGLELLDGFATASIPVEWVDSLPAGPLHHKTGLTQSGPLSDTGGSTHQTTPITPIDGQTRALHLATNHGFIGIDGQRPRLHLARDNTFTGIDGATPGLHLARGNAFIGIDGPTPGLQLVPGGARSNLERARELRTTLLKFIESPHPQWVQTEFHPNDRGGASSRGALAPEGLENEADGRDAQILAGFERVWVYTQGISLEHAVRQDEHQKARGLARWLCDEQNAVWEGDHILGWPFSKNTQDDTWKDARLVTGASAWAIHGLGAFLASASFVGLEADEKTHFRTCYSFALAGLKRHRVAVDLTNGARKPPGSACAPEDCAFLMTAGWTTQGLQHAKSPWKLGLTENESETWSYYSILDALGYDDFDETQPPAIQRTWTQGGHTVEDEVPELTRDQFDILKKRTQATNVVTEHNLDVLSVLNHSLRHQDKLWPHATQAEQEARRADLEAWRDGVRTGLFTLLWESGNEKPAIEHKAPNACRTETKTIEMKGRVITGGEFSASGQFLAHPEVAIDNCSWLALSVDYDTLPSRHVEQLEVCLAYSIDKFADHMPHGVNNQCYFGAHYFPNTFHDPYIDQSDQQEVSYHLEATAGLILGLHRFYEAHPERGEPLEQTARTLWTGVQGFVRDHGFIYSSRRIQDLSARLASSTAVIWYLDVYEALEGQDGRDLRPLKNYAEAVESQSVARSVHDAWATLKDQSEPYLPPDGQDGQEYDLVRSQGGRAGTRVEDQALAILAAVSQNDFEQAARWASGLLHAVVRSPNDLLGEDWHFLVEIHTHDEGARVSQKALETELLALYALFRFQRLRPANTDPEDRFQSRLRETLTQVLSTLRRRHLRHQHGLTWFAQSEDDDDGQSARTTDQILAYFVLQEAAHLDLLPALKIDPEALKTALLSIFWDEDTHQPRHTITSDADLSPPSPGTSALYSLFASDVHDVVKAQQALDASFAARSTLAKANAQASFVESPLVWLLALRRASDFDPRLAELALLEFEALEGTAFPAERILVHHPQGTFGAQPGPLLVGTTPKEQRDPARHGIMRLLSKAEDAYVETVGALFASDPEPYLFDALITRLTHLRFLEAMLENGVPVDQWAANPATHGAFSGRIRETVADLRGLCEPGSPLEARRAKMERYLGLSCEDTTQLFEAHLVRRGGTPDADMGLLIWSTRTNPSSSPHAYTLTRLTSWLFDHHHQDPNDAPGDRVLGPGVGAETWGDATTTWQSPTMDEPLPTRPPTGWTVGRAREALRQRFKDAVDDTLGLGESPLSAPLGATYELSGVDSIAAHHPQSPAYWERTSFELRAFHQAQRSNPAFRYTFKGTPNHPPELNTSPEGLDRSQILRQLINRYADGRLPKIADETGLPVFLLHRMLKTGQANPDVLQKIAQGDVQGKMAVDAWALRDDRSIGEKNQPLSVLFAASMAPHGNHTIPTWETLLEGASALETPSILTLAFEPPDRPESENHAGPWRWPRFFEQAFAEPDEPGASSPVTALFGPSPEVVAHMAVALEFAKQLGAKEAFKITLVEILNVAVGTGLAAAMNEQEINALIDQVFVEENHNVILVEEGASLTVPLDYEFVGREPLFSIEDPSEIYAWPLEPTSHHPPGWENAFALSIIDNLGFGVGPEFRTQAAQWISAFIQGYVPQNIILKKTSHGVEIYRKPSLALWHGSARGVVLHVKGDGGGAELVHRQPGSWSRWYEEHVLTEDLPEYLREAYLRAVSAWLLDDLLAVPGRLSFHERKEQIKRQITGAGPHVKYVGAAGFSHEETPALIPATIIPAGTGRVAYYGLPHPTYAAAVQAVPDVAYCVTGARPGDPWAIIRADAEGDSIIDHMNGRRGNFITLSKEPTFDAGRMPEFKRAVTKSKGKVWIYKIRPPEGTLEVRSILEALGVRGSDTDKDTLLTPAIILSEYMISRHQVDENGIAIPGTEERNPEYAPAHKTPDNQTVTGPVIPLYTDLDLARWTLQHRGSDRTPAKANLARLTAPKLLIRGSHKQPTGTDGAFTTGLGPSIDEWGNPSDMTSVTHIRKTLETYIKPGLDNAPLRYFAYYIENGGRALNLEAIGEGGDYAESVFFGKVLPNEIIGAQESIFDPKTKKLTLGEYFVNPNYVPRSQPGTISGPSKGPVTYNVFDPAKITVVGDDVSQSAFYDSLHIASLVLRSDGFLELNLPEAPPQLENIGAVEKSIVAMNERAHARAEARGWSIQGLLRYWPATSNDFGIFRWNRAQGKPLTSAAEETPDGALAERLGYPIAVEVRPYRKNGAQVAFVSPEHQPKSIKLDLDGSGKRPRLTTTSVREVLRGAAYVFSRFVGRKTSYETLAEYVKHVPIRTKAASQDHLGEVHLEFKAPLKTMPESELIDFLDLAGHAAILHEHPFIIQFDNPPASEELNSPLRVFTKTKADWDTSTAKWNGETYQALAWSEGPLLNEEPVVVQFVSPRVPSSLKRGIVPRGKNNYRVQETYEDHWPSTSFVEVTTKPEQVQERVEWFDERVYIYTAVIPAKQALDLSIWARKNTKDEVSYGEGARILVADGIAWENIASWVRIAPSTPSKATANSDFSAQGYDSKVLNRVDQSLAETVAYTGTPLQGEIPRWGDKLDCCGAITKTLSYELFTPPVPRNSGFADVIVWQNTGKELGRAWVDDKGFLHFYFQNMGYAGDEEPPSIRNRRTRVLNTLIEQVLNQEILVGKRVRGAFAEWLQDDQEWDSLEEKIKTEARRKTDPRTQDDKGLRQIAAERIVVSESLSGQGLLQHGFVLETITHPGGGGLLTTFSRLPGLAPGHVSTLQKSLGYTFTKKHLLEQALSPETTEFESLEYLGDAVLEVVAITGQMKQFPAKSSAHLKRLREQVVNNFALNVLAQQLELPRFFNVSFVGEERNFRNKEKTPADAVEALIAAMFLDADQLGPVATHMEPWFAIPHETLTFNDRWFVFRTWARETYGPGVRTRYEHFRDHDGQHKTQILVNGQGLGEAATPDAATGKSAALANVYATHDTLLQKLFSSSEANQAVPLGTQFPPPEDALTSEEEALAQSFARFVPDPKLVNYVLKANVHWVKNQHLAALGRAVLELVQRRRHVGYYEEPMRHESTTRAWHPTWAFKLGLGKFLGSAAPRAKNYGEALSHVFRAMAGLVFVVSGLDAVDEMIEPLFDYGGAPKQIAHPTSPEHLRLALWSHEGLGHAPTYLTERKGNQYYTEIRAAHHVLGSGEGPSPSDSEREAVQDAITRNEVPGEDLQPGSTWKSEPRVWVPPGDRTTRLALEVPPRLASALPTSAGAGGATRTLPELEDELGFAFSNTNLLSHATTHPTLYSESKFETLGLVGQQVFSLLLAHDTAERFPKRDATQIGLLAAEPHSPANLAASARTLGLEDWLRLQRKKEDRRQVDAVLVSAFHSLAGAMHYESEGDISSIKPSLIPLLVPPAQKLTEGEKWSMLRALGPISFKLPGELKYDTILDKDGSPQTTVWIGKEVIAETTGPNAEAEALKQIFLSNPELKAALAREESQLPRPMSLALQFPPLASSPLTDAERRILDLLPVELPTPSSIRYATRGSVYAHHAERLSLLGDRVIALVFAEAAVSGHPKRSVEKLKSFIGDFNSGLALYAWRLGLADVLDTSAPDRSFSSGLRYTLRLLVGLAYVQGGMALVRAILQPFLTFEKYPMAIASPWSQDALRLTLWSMSKYGLPAYQFTATSNGHRVKIFAGKKRIPIAEAEGPDEDTARQNALRKAINDHDIP